MKIIKDPKQEGIALATPMSFFKELAEAMLAQERDVWHVVSDLPGDLEGSSVEHLRAGLRTYLGPLSLDLEYADDSRTPESYRFRIGRPVLRT
jgi:hypothetical protein